ncbi:sensor histidine kinase [Halobaculum limi]|uniref:sensor histidine kinase n=1 Tax=Halobaculum limi TaxID=3031916 RepID=UPI002404DA65|nr:HAMP domain-containing sensor histidine kinase [Halobaculum sp. YSMS11]
MSDDAHDDGRAATTRGSLAAEPSVSSAWTHLPTILVVYGVVAGLSLSDRWILGGSIGGTPVGGTVAAVTTVGITLPFVLGFVFAGVVLGRGSLDVARYPRITGWWLGATGVFLAINLLMMTVWPPSSTAIAVGWLRFGMLFGGSWGLLVGIVEARSIDRARAAERERVRAELTEENREWVEYLNSILRHEVLNASNVAAGNVSLLLDRDDLDEDVRRRLAVIERACHDMDEVIREVRLLVASDRGEFDPHEVDLHPVLIEEAAAVEAAVDGATVETDLPERLPALADEAVGRVFSNLIANGVEHNDDPEPTVRVDAELREEAVVCRVADDGPGVPSSERAGLFEAANDGAADHGLGLHIVQTLVERYEGDIELTETGSDGSVFTVRLPRAEGSQGAFGGERETAVAGA